MTEYVIDKRFQSRVEKSSRVLECAEAFGLGLEDNHFVVFDNVKVDVERGDIVYITGQSGAGKSLLLRELASQMKDEGLRVQNIDEVVVDYNSPLIEQVGTSINEGIKILSFAGLNDAYLFIRTPSELSDGQMYRFRVAKLIESGADVWVADEFGAVLDRTTAKVVAFSVQKMARAVGSTLMVATTHKDLKEELGPTLYIDKRFQERMNIETRKKNGD